MEHIYGKRMSDFEPGDRIELHPSIDWWMQGARFGTVLGHQATKAKIKLDKLRHLQYIEPYWLRRIEP